MEKGKAESGGGGDLWTGAVSLEDDGNVDRGGEIVQIEDGLERWILLPDDHYPWHMTFRANMIIGHVPVHHYPVS